MTAVAHAQPERPLFGNFWVTAGSQPRGIVLEDFNGDGLMDLVTAQGECPTVAISFGTNDDYLMPANPVGFGCHGEDVARGDFNEDGIADIVSTTEVGEVRMHLGTGGGAFANPVIYSVGANLLLNMDAGDFNGDGHDDVVTSSLNTPSNLWLLPGNGDGTLGVPVVVDTGFYGFVTSGHLNGDSHLDLIATEGLGTGDLVVILADGLGGFQTPVEYPVGGGVAIADLDDDGDADLATTVPSGQISFLEGNGDGSFQAPVAYPAAGVTHDRIVASDLNADGVLDLVAAGGGGASLLLGAGDGSFGAAFTTGWPGYAWDLIVTDIDKDSRPDVVGTDGQSIRIMLGNGDGTVVNGVIGLERDSTTNYVSRRFDDLDLDGLPDLVLIDDNPAGVFPLYGNVDGSFEFGVSVSSPDGLVDAAVADFGVNATPDLLMLADPSEPFGSPDKAVWVLFSLGPRNFAPSELEGPQVTANPSSLNTADLDGDGLTDVLVTDEVTNEVIVMMGLGSAQFTLPFTRYTVGTAPVAASLARIDGDLHLDLVVVNRDSDDVALLLGNGDGTFQPPSFIATGGEPSSVNLGDLNGDGNLDLVVTNQTFSVPKDVTVRLGNGDGTFGPDLRLASGIYSETATLGDLDRDGNLDLVLGTVRLYRGNGDGTFDTWSSHSGGPLSLAADVNQDGWVDLITHVSVLINLGGPGGLGFESDRTTMRWPGILGADSYNLYRGDTASLTDANLDGLADGGYGLCLSGSDPDPTDTEFTDGEEPASGGDGFFYLRAVVTASDEDLGQASSGLERSPTAACP